MTHSRSVVLLCVTAVGMTLAASPAAAGSKLAPLTLLPEDGLSRALAGNELSEAKYALERARALFRPRAVARRYGAVARPNPRAATFVLRDLVLRLDALTGSDRAAAERILARPSDGPADPLGNGWQPGADRERECTSRWCVHWVEDTADSPPLVDDSGNGLPDWIDGTMAALQKVFAREVDDLGFPRPQNDQDAITTSGNPSGALDVYLADIGDDGLYGYCTSDDPDRFNRWDISAYCVVDDDFRQSQFPNGVFGQAANRVTLAHEVHHALQFALDYGEDIWIMEGGATAMERAVYPGIRDNYQYLAASQIVRPGIPLDLSTQRSASIYGNWIFFQYLSERFGGPRIMRRIWARLDARNGRPDDYSTQGLKRVLRARNRSLRRVFTGFSLANRRPRTSYDLSALPGWLHAPTHKRYRLGRGTPRRADTLRPRHLTSRWVTFHRRSDAPRNARLRIRLDLPGRSRGGAARVTIVKKSGRRTWDYFSLDRAGKGRETVAFGRKVRRVELLLVNASSRFDCSRYGPYSCYGRARDDRRGLSFVASLR